MVKRTLISAFRPLVNLRVTLADSAHQSRRFSATPARGLSAVFAETENPELNEVLTQIQEKIILPAYLPPAQKKLVYNKNKSDYLQRNPVVIELDGLEHTFKTINRFKDIPNSKKIFREALSLMKTKEDWDNLGTLLAGFKKAGIRLQRWHYATMIRLAGASGQPYAIIECAKQVEKTGLALSRKDGVVTLLTHINKKIITSNGAKSEVLQALKWDQMVWDLLQRPEHHTQRLQPFEQLHSNAIVRGMILYAQASAIQTQQAAGASVQELIQELRDNVEFLISAWARQGSDDLTRSLYLRSINCRVERATPPQESSRHLSPYHYIMAVAQNVRGMELAQEIIGDAANDLKPIHDALDNHLVDFIKADEKNIKGWAVSYREVTGRVPEWEKYL